MSATRKGKKRSHDQGGQVSDPLKKAKADGANGAWLRLFDSNYQTYYYTNSATGESTWEKPEGFDPTATPSASAFASTPAATAAAAAAPRAAQAAQAAAAYAPLPAAVVPQAAAARPAAAASDVTQNPHYEIGAPHRRMAYSEPVPEVPIEERQKIWLFRKAKQQVKPDEAEEIRKKYIPEGANEYNIWYDRYTGPDNNRRRDRDMGPTVTRCSLEKHAGQTLADVRDPKGTFNFYCVYFARGICHMGHKCNFFHRIPTRDDLARFDQTQDVFGRPRHGTHKQNMGGTGTFESDSRTLYISGLLVHDGLEKSLYKEFGEWGTLEQVNVIARLNIAFIKYYSRLNAEFAKIAMSDQLFEGKVQINVRWAHPDPNPRAQAKKLREDRQMLLAAAYARGLIQYDGESEAADAQAHATSYQALEDKQPHKPVEPAHVGPATAEELEREEAVRQAQQDMDRLDQVFKRAGHAS